MIPCELRLVGAARPSREAQQQDAVPLISGDADHSAASWRQQYALANRIEHPRNVYLREKDILGPLDHWLAKIFAPHRIDDTIDLLATTGGLNPTAGHTPNAEQAKKTIKQCDAKLTTHRAALEAGADPVLVTGWITEAQATRARAEAELRAAQSARRAQPTRDDIASLVRANSDLVIILTRTEPAERADLYQKLGLVLTYDSGKQKVLVEMNLNQHLNDPRGVSVGVRGGTRTVAPRRSGVLGELAPVAP
ncbi:hypothetical protein [Kitasatospora kifunensis]|uniref:Uncharacterized protein n=1 Tax=Kitasatospora kifunensis TaxID=58351 RepID=A0A7W7VTM1_KITKI|nr:hypothetical protein [Kitasatospora kifunensis]MBB4921913.1 hypothetical protein [Kitasatospora kifunensis]